MLVFLIGYRGTGKSSVARLVALRLGWEWVDADVEIELLAGKSIAAIFADDGEQKFRDLESDVLAKLCLRENVVIACGGGIVIRPENRARLREAGKVVWLQASPQTIVARLEADPTTTQRRPQLTSAGVLAEVTHLLQQREPWYRECADANVDTDDRRPEQVADEILRQVTL